MAAEQGMIESEATSEALVSMGIIYRLVRFKRSLVRQDRTDLVVAARAPTGHVIHSLGRTTVNITLITFTLLQGDLVV